MIPVEEAKSLILNNCPPPKAVKTGLERCLSFVLARDVHSPIALPPFDHSAMDGYSVSCGDLRHGAKKFQLIGEVKAGQVTSKRLKKHATFRIFTGAKIPYGSDAVIRQEDAYEKEGFVTFSEQKISKGENIRTKGSHIHKGELALRKGTILSPASIGFIASMGLRKTDVFKRPAVSLITTGSELNRSGSRLKPGMIYESNSFTIRAALQQTGHDPVFVSGVADDLTLTCTKVRCALKKSDMLIITGGISVGKYDFVREVLLKEGIIPFFHGIAQKPGKPLFFGKNRKKLVFGLPGNPAAALICFYEYVLPALQVMSGYCNTGLETIHLKTCDPIRSKEDRACFVRSKLMNGNVLPLNGQDSSALRTFSESDSIIYLPAGTKMVEKGDEVEVHLLPALFRGNREIRK